MTEEQERTLEQRLDGLEARLDAIIAELEDLLEKKRGNR